MMVNGFAGGRATAGPDTWVREIRMVLSAEDIASSTGAMVTIPTLEVAPAGMISVVLADRM